MRVERGVCVVCTFVIIILPVAWQGWKKMWPCCWKKTCVCIPITLVQGWTFYNHCANTHVRSRIVIIDVIIMEIGLSLFLLINCLLPPITVAQGGFSGVALLLLQQKNRFDLPCKFFVCYSGGKRDKKWLSGASKFLGRNWKRDHEAFISMLLLYKWEFRVLLLWLITDIFVVPRLYCL